MDERSIQQGGTERPLVAADAGAPAPGPAHLADPRALTILTTEHWSLLTARSLVYNEAFARTVARAGRQAARAPVPGRGADSRPTCTCNVSRPYLA